MNDLLVSDITSSDDCPDHGPYGDDDCPKCRNVIAWHRRQMTRSGEAWNAGRGVAGVAVLDRGVYSS
jgi:hypothetical protein